jgi:hypothetical protein
LSKLGVFYECSIGGSSWNAVSAVVNKKSSKYHHQQNHACDDSGSIQSPRSSLSGKSDSTNKSGNDRQPDLKQKIEPELNNAPVEHKNS